MAFEALIFDVGGVMIPHDNAALARRIAGRCASPEAALAAVDEIGFDRRYETGELPIEHLHERVSRELGYGAPWDTFVEDWCSHFEVDFAMVDLVERLACTNRVVLFSNSNAVHWPRVLERTDRRLGAFETYLSHELGMVKPDVDAFLTVAGRAGVAPGRCLFVDDRPANVEGARRAGFQAEVFTDQPRLEALLREAKVTWPNQAQMERC